MSAHSSIKLSPDGEKLDPSKVSLVRFACLVVGVVGLVISLILLFSSKGYAYSWLFGFYYFFTIALGGLFWTLLHNASNSGWGVVVRRIWEQLACLIPVFGILALPFLFPNVRDALWDWLRHHTEISSSIDGGSMKEKLKIAAKADPHHHLLISKLGFLNKPFFYFRFFFYFIALGAIAFFMRKVSSNQDATGDVNATFRMRFWSCAFLPVFAVCATFIGVDFLMALDFSWFSTMWGVYLFAGSALNAMALTIVIVSLLRKLGYLKMINQEHYHVMGKLTFAFVVFWAYVTFSQYFLIWYANITEETRYFLVRNTDGWHTLSVAVFICHFCVSFLILLPAWVKRSSKLLTIGALWVLFAHFLDIYHIVIPERFISINPQEVLMAATSVSESPMAFLGDLLAFVTVGALVAFAFLTNLSKRNLYPSRDPRLLESVNLSN